MTESIDLDGIAANRQLALPPKITDICEARDSAIAKLSQALTLIDQAESTINGVCTYAFPSSEIHQPRIEELVKSIDRRLWQFAFDYTGFMQIMDREAKRNFMDDVERKAPPFTIDNIRTTFLQFSQDASTMYARGIVNVFLRLSDKHKTNTNEPFKIDEKCILTYMVSQSYGGGLEVRRWGGYAEEQLNDIDRVFKTLDGQKHIQHSLEHAINAAWKNKGAKIYEDSYYRIKGFKNTNMHIQFKRADLLEKANKIISEFYNGTALAGK